LSGVVNIDVEDWMNQLETTGFSPESQTIAYFGQILRKWNQDPALKPRLQSLLRFTTGLNRLPQGGFQELDPPFSIVKGQGTQYPIGRTCVNQLILIDYATMEELERKVMFIKLFIGVS
jgi:hypothetical protein